MKLRFIGGPYDGQTIQLPPQYVKLFNTTIGHKHRFNEPGRGSYLYKVVSASKTEVALRFVSEVHNIQH